MVKSQKSFLTAVWRDLVMLNWEVSESLLLPYLPRGVEFDALHSKLYVSIVAFRFLETRVLGCPVPWHRDFEEVNLRFYVRRKVAGEVRRGVVFIREYVPRFWVAALARALYNERYRAVSMSHEVVTTQQRIQATYSWRDSGAQHHVRTLAEGAPSLASPDSREMFIAEHYWGYSRLRDGSTIEYRVEHPSWRIWTDCQVEISSGVGASYGAEWLEVLGRAPDFSFIAEGSPVSVFWGARL
jgi:uncharacterized protein YqjF (DUF2071 family)